MVSSVWSKILNLFPFSLLLSGVAVLWGRGHIFRAPIHALVHERDKLGYLVINYTIQYNAVQFIVLYCIHGDEKKRKLQTRARTDTTKQSVSLHNTGRRPGEKRIIMKKKTAYTHSSSRHVSISPSLQVGTILCMPTTTVARFETFVLFH